MSLIKQKQKSSYRNSTLKRPPISNEAKVFTTQAESLAFAVYARPFVSR